MASLHCFSGNTDSLSLQVIISLHMRLVVDKNIESPHFYASLKRQYLYIYI